MIVFDQVSKTYTDGTTAVSNISFEAPSGSITVLVGPSGCGKTTSMRMINRLIDPTSGTVALNGEDTRGANIVQLRRKIGYVIQNAGLLPHRNALDNVAALPRLVGSSKTQARRRAAELLELVGLDESFFRRFPWQLSGGQQQRVGVARALATDPPFLLMDEPFSAVDPIVRAQLQKEFLKLQEQLGKTIVMVTHDIDEALTLGDQLVVLRQGGSIAQIASPKHLLHKPADSFVADFLGASRGFRALGFSHADHQVNVTAADSAVIGTPAQDCPHTASGWFIATDAAGAPLGWVHRGEVGVELTTAAIEHAATIASTDSSLRDMLDAALSSPTGSGILTDASGTLAGTINTAEVLAALERTRGRNRGVKS